MRLERVVWNVLIFNAIWIGFDSLFGILDDKTVHGCLGAVTMAFMLYFDEGENRGKN